MNVEAPADLLRTMLEGMRHGIVLFDADQNLTAPNPLAAELCCLLPEAFRLGSSLAALHRLQVEAGEFDGEAAMANFVDDKSTGPVGLPPSYTRARPNGVVTEVQPDAVSGGGMVRTHSDISALRCAEPHLGDHAGLMSRMLEGMRHGVAVFRDGGTLLAANTFSQDLPALTEPGAAAPQAFGKEADLQAFPKGADAHGMPEGRHSRPNTRGLMLEVVTDRLAGGAASCAASPT